MVSPSRILPAVHETAGRLLNAGFIDKCGMRMHEQLCLPPMQEYSVEAIRAIRDVDVAAWVGPTHSVSAEMPALNTFPGELINFARCLDVVTR